MDLKEIERIEAEYYADTFSRLPVAISHGWW